MRGRNVAGGWASAREEGLGKRELHVQGGRGGRGAHELGLPGVAVPAGEGQGELIGGGADGGKDEAHRLPVGNPFFPLPADAMLAQ